LQTKKCNRCKEEKPLGEFHKNKQKPDGLQSFCKECSSKKNKEYYIKNKEKELARSKKWKKENRERVNENQRKLRLLKITNGICRDCMNRPIDYTRSISYCSNCLDSANTRTNKLHKSRKEKGLCIYCGKKLDSNYTWCCSKCCEKSKKHDRIRYNGFDPEDFKIENLLKDVKISEGEVSISD